MANGDGDRTTQVSRFTLITTNAMKVAGLVIFVREAVTTKEAIVMGVCALMMAGVQALERLVIVFLERFFGPPGDVRR